MVDINDDAKAGGYRRVEVLTGPGRRRKWSVDDKARIVEETLQPGTVVADVARRWQVSSQQVAKQPHRRTHAMVLETPSRHRNSGLITKGPRRRAYDGAITLAFCWSHVRREFIELAKGKTAPIAAETLQRIAALYVVEADARGKPPDIRRAVRQERSRPLVEDLFDWLSVQFARLPSGSPTAQAIRYALNHRAGLVRFLDDGRVELDNNTVERAIRPICLSRKNALFASGDDGGARWAAVASLVETCKLNGVDPQRYLTHLLTRLVNGWPNSRIDELMPWCWKHAAAIETQA